VIVMTLKQLWQQWVARPKRDDVHMVDQVRRERLSALIEIQRGPADRVLVFPPKKGSTT
jgi:hypothetical protein